MRRSARSQAVADSPIGTRVSCPLKYRVFKDRRVVTDFVAEVFCPSECVRLIQDQASMRNVDSRIHSLRFDCCVFLFYSFSAVTFATKSANRGLAQHRKKRCYSMT